MGDLKERDVKGCVVVIDPTSAAESSGCLSTQMMEGVVVSPWEPWCRDANGDRVASHSEGRSAGSGGSLLLEGAQVWLQLNR